MRNSINEVSVVEQLWKALDKPGQKHSSIKAGFGVIIQIGCGVCNLQIDHFKNMEFPITPGIPHH